MWHQQINFFALKFLRDFSLKKYKIWKNILANAHDTKLDITSFHEDGVPVHSVDLHARCPRCLAAEASKPGLNDGESLWWWWWLGKLISEILIAFVSANISYKVNTVWIIIKSSLMCPHLHWKLHSINCVSINAHT